VIDEYIELARLGLSFGRPDGGCLGYPSTLIKRELHHRLLVLLGHKISAESMTYKVRIQVSILWSEVIPHAGYYAVGGRDLYASTHGGHP
jgi:hypothetical protein